MNHIVVSFWLDIALSRDWVCCSKRFVYERVLDEIGSAIKKTDDRLENIDDLPSELVDQIVDDESIVIEYLLGTAFVLCQAYITDVISMVISLHKFARSQNVALKATTTQKQDILKFGHEGNEYSSAEIIDAFANYFKHRDEWGSNWQKLPERTQKTVRIIESAGARSGSTGNLRQGSIELGNPDFIETGIFLDKLEQWHLDLVDAYRAEFEKVFAGESSGAY